MNKYYDWKLALIRTRDPNQPTRGVLTLNDPRARNVWYCKFANSKQPFYHNIIIGNVFMTYSLWYEFICSPSDFMYNWIQLWNRVTCGACLNFKTIFCFVAMLSYCVTSRLYGLAWSVIIIVYTILLPWK